MRKDTGAHRRAGGKWEKMGECEEGQEDVGRIGGHGEN